MPISYQDATVFAPDVYTNTAGPIRCYTSHCLCFCEAICGMGAICLIGTGDCFLNKNTVVDMCGCRNFNYASTCISSTSCEVIKINWLNVECLALDTSSAVHATANTNYHNRQGYMCSFVPEILKYGTGDDFRIRVYGSWAFLQCKSPYESCTPCVCFGGIMSSGVSCTCCLCIDIVKSGATCWAEVCYGTTCCCYANGNILFCIDVSAKNSSTGYSSSLYGCMAYLPNCIEKISGNVKWLCCF